MADSLVPLGWHRLMIGPELDLKGKGKDDYSIGSKCIYSLALSIPIDDMYFCSSRLLRQIYLRKKVANPYLPFRKCKCVFRTLHACIYWTK